MENRGVTGFALFIPEPCSFTCGYPAILPQQFRCFWYDVNVGFEVRVICYK